MLWSGWGDPAEATTLPAGVLGLLEQGLGVERAGRGAPGRRGAPAIESVELAPSRLSAEQVAALRAVAALDRSDEARLRHLRGKSTPDLLRIRSGDFTAAPDGVASPGSHEQVEQLLTLCSDQRIAVVPFGGGTSVVGGLTPLTEMPRVALDLRNLNALLELDEVSRTARLQPGLRVPEAEALLNPHGYTIGHFPQSYEYLTLGGAAAARSSGQASAGYGRFDERVVGLKVATPSGTIELGRAPKSAAGPDLRQLFLGSEGAFGVITELTVEVAPAPTTRVYEGWWFESFTAGAAALRKLIQDGPTPTVLRLSDEAETALNLARPGEIADGDSGPTGGCLAITGYEGTAENVQARRAAVTAMLEGTGARRDPSAGEAWSHGRYRAPYLRDALIDAGALVETLETVTFWSNLDTLYRAVGDALRNALGRAVVLCHISHVYRSGASLYFTVAAAQETDPLAQWAKAKRAANDAIIDAGGSITHHHGVGTDHREHYAQQVGPLAIAALKAVKDTLDPNGIMNPGVLV